MTKKELIPDDEIVTVAQWSEGMYELFNIAYVCGLSKKGLIKIQPGDEYKEEERYCLRVKEEPDEKD